MKTVTIRLKSPLYEEAKHLASKEGKSFNALMQELLLERLKKEEYQALFKAFSLLGEDKEKDIEYYFAAQSELCLEDEPC